MWNIFVPHYHQQFSCKAKFLHTKISAPRTLSAASATNIMYAYMHVWAQESRWEWPGSGLVNKKLLLEWNVTETAENVPRNLRQSQSPMSTNALCQSCGNLYFKVPNFDKLFLSGFSSRVSKILRRFVWTPQEFRKRKKLRFGEEKEEKMRKTWRGCLLRSPLVSKNPSW